MKRYLIFAVVAIFHAASAEQIDPPVPCRSHEECTTLSRLPQDGICSNGYCLCTEDSIIRNCTTEEIARKKSTDEDVLIPCQKDQDCNNILKSNKDTFCKDGYCLCRNDIGIKNCSSADIIRQENRNAGQLIFRPCKIDQECNFPRGMCNTTVNQCDCQKDYVLSSSKIQCLEKATGFNFSCLDEKQCTAFLPNFTCSSNRCTCVSGYHYVEADNACYSTVDFGNECTHSQECSLIDGAVCSDRKVCGCPAETVISTDKKKCLPVAREILQECIQDDQCSITFSHSLCIDRQCQCEHEYHFESAMNNCFISKALDQECGNSYECYQVEDENENTTLKALQCADNKCVCAQDYYRTDNVCVSGAASIVSSTLTCFILSMLVYGSTVWKF